MDYDLCAAESRTTSCGLKSFWNQLKCRELCQYSVINKAQFMNSDPSAFEFIFTAIVCLCFLPLVFFFASGIWCGNSRRLFRSAISGKNRVSPLPLMYTFECHYHKKLADRRLAGTGGNLAAESQPLIVWWFCLFVRVNLVCGCVSVCF